MSDTVQNPTNEDLDTLTDDQVMELGPEAVQALMEQEGQEDVTNEEVPVEDTDLNNGDVTSEADTTGKETDKVEDPEPEVEPAIAEDPLEGAEPEVTPTDGVDPQAKVSPEDVSKSPENEAKKEDTAPKTEKNPKDDAKKSEKITDTAASDFMTKMMAPFKADGRDMQIRSAEDGIRLMQMGVNYNRRMQQMKPLKEQDAMLRANGFDTPEKLNYLIDIAQGKPDAILKLLKEKGIDPLDFDTTKDNTYQPTNHKIDSKQLDFEEAINNTMATPNGPSLIRDVNASWDDNSKEALRDQPEIFNNLLAQMDTGVYQKIKGELEYQRTLGHLTNVPFLQAYHQVGDAMQKAGVFNQPATDHSGGLAPLQAKPAPIDTGIRKAAEKPKTEQPNPELSSNPRTIPSNDGIKDEKDYSSMSDEDFMKMANPV